MSKKAAALLWNRMRFTVLDGVIDIDTGLTQPNRSFPDYSPGEPPLGTSGVATPAPGALPPSRIMVIPLAPLSAWQGVTHGEPYYNTTTGTIHVQFSNGVTTEVNGLFWDPHSLVGPGDADTYNAAQ
jgi:hypothetical protein